MIKVRRRVSEGVAGTVRSNQGSVHSGWTAQSQAYHKPKDRGEKLEHRNRRHELLLVQRHEVRRGQLLHMQGTRI